MPRRARLSLPGIPWHIIQRDNDRSVCFRAEEDYRFYLHYLHEFAVKFGCALHAYVLMTNHVHLLLTPKQKDSAALLMKHLGQRYVQYFNRTYRRTGTLWEGRFRSCLTQSEDYVLACYRYIELNPVRAAMVMRPEDYRWSSYAANGLGRPNVLITPHAQYLGLGLTPAERCAHYRQLFRAHVEEALLDEIRAATNGNYALGNARFQAKVEAKLGQRAVRGVAGRPRAAALDTDERQGKLL